MKLLGYLKTGDSIPEAIIHIHGCLLGDRVPFNFAFTEASQKMQPLGSRLDFPNPVGHWVVIDQDQIGRGFGL